MSILDGKFVLARNSDSTEGKGHTVVFGLADTEEDAVFAVRAQGTMGVGDGEIYVLADSLEPPYDRLLIEGRNMPFSAFFKRIYGYRKNWLGNWDYGWLDLRDAPTNDPEFAEYQRLQKKFEGRVS